MMPLYFITVHLSGITKLFCSMATKSVSQSSWVSVGPPILSSSLQHQKKKKTKAGSVKVNHTTIKKTERMIRIDIWYYGICKSIYELWWYIVQESRGHNSFMGKIINLSHGSVPCAWFLWVLFCLLTFAEMQCCHTPPVKQLMLF